MFFPLQGNRCKRFSNYMSAGFLKELHLKFGKGITVPTNIEVKKICYVTFFLFYLIVCIELCLGTANAIACCTLIDKSLLLYNADISIY